MLNEVQIPRIKFIASFGADGDYHSQFEYGTTYLNKRNGELAYAWTNKERMALEFGDDFVAKIPAAKEPENDPGRYLELNSMSHSNHLQVLQSFLSKKMD